MKIPDKYLTKGWNNLLTVVFGLPILIYTVLVLRGSSDLTLARCRGADTAARSAVLRNCGRSTLVTCGSHVN